MFTIVLMNILAIDIGSYSIKFVEFSLEKKKIYFLHKQEVLLNDVIPEYNEDISIDEIKLDTVKKFIKDQYDGKVIFQIPSQMVTSRYLNLPVTAAKKINMMLPFRLDEDLPFSSTNAHYAKTIRKQGKTSQLFVNITQKEKFNEFYENLTLKNILPSVLTSEVSLFDIYAEQASLKESCLILDIGHQTTKAYLIHNEQLVRSHISHTAGFDIDKSIAATYNISEDEASVYKHKNSFFLTEKLYDSVNSDQQDFGMLMEKTIWPLVLDLKRWILGYRVKFGHPITQVLITGGTSNIKNIDNFLAQHLELPVNLFEIHTEILVAPEIEQEKSSLTTSMLMATAQLSKTAPINFLFGKFSGKNTQYFPLHSVSFISSRITAICLFAILFFGVERMFFLQKKEIKLNRTIVKLLKSPKINMPKKDQRKYKRYPERVLALLKKKNKVITQEIKTIQSAKKIDAVSPLVSLSQLVQKNNEVFLEKFYTDGGLVRATFASKKDDALKSFYKQIEAISLNEKNVKLLEDRKKIDLTFQE